MADQCWSSWVGAVTPYAVLLRLLIDGRVSGEEVEVVIPVSGGQRAHGKTRSTPVGALS